MLEDEYKRPSQGSFYDKEPQYRKYVGVYLVEKYLNENDLKHLWNSLASSPLTTHW